MSEVAGHLDINFLKSNILIFPFLLILSFSLLYKKQLRIILFSSQKSVNKRFGQIEIFVSISHVHKSVIFLRTAYNAFSYHAGIFEPVLFLLLNSLCYCLYIYGTLATIRFPEK